MLKISILQEPSIIHENNVLIHQHTTSYMHTDAVPYNSDILRYEFIRLPLLYEIQKMYCVMLVHY